MDKFCGDEVPVVYGLTIGEYGKMVNGEKWLKNGVQAKYIDSDEKLS
jgi:hypothetical protein